MGSVTKAVEPGPKIKSIQDNPAKGLINNSSYGVAYNGVNDLAGGKIFGQGGDFGSSLLGMGDNAANGAFGANGLARPQASPIQSATGVGQVMQSQVGADQALASQNNLLSALQAQNGLGQQNAIAGQQQQLANQLGTANGIGTQNSAIQGLQGAAGQYANIAAGRGPNPAQAMLNQQTGQNVANQTAMMASQRGAGANPALLARQAAQQGAATQQQAVGQGATMQANQQIAGLQGLVGAQQAVGGLGGQQLAAQQAQQQALANQANTVAGQQIGATTANTQANLANMTQNQNALQGINQSNVAMQSNINNANAGLAQQQMKGQQQLAGGLMGGLASAIGMAGGGEVPHMADGGLPNQSVGTPDTGVFNPNMPQAPAPVMPSPVAPAQPIGAAAAGPTSSFGQFLSGFNSGMKEGVPEQKGEDSSPFPKGDDAVEKGSSDLTKGLIMAMMASKGGLAETGGHVKAKTPSQKPVKKGDHLENDKVPAMLSAGEIVIPRSVINGRDPVRGSAEFVRSVLAKKRMKK